MLSIIYAIFIKKRWKTTFKWFIHNLVSKHDVLWKTTFWVILLLPLDSFNYSNFIIINFCIVWLNIILYFRDYCCSYRFQSLTIQVTKKYMSSYTMHLFCSFQAQFVLSLLYFMEAYLIYDIIEWMELKKIKRLKCFGGMSRVGCWQVWSKIRVVALDWQCIGSNLWYSSHTSFTWPVKNKT